MAKIAVSKQTSLELVLFNVPPVWGHEVILLDQDGFPWKLHENYEVDAYWAMVEPLRERNFNSPKISTLEPYDEGLAKAYLNRVFDYLSRVEALDLGIKRVRSGTWFQEWASNEWVTDPAHDFNHDVGTTPKDTITFTDSSGMSWGPLNCNPLIEPTAWPFPGSALFSGDLTYTPIKHRKDAWTIKFGNLSLDVFSFLDLHTWVENLMIYGWFETIQRLCPNGMQLSHPGHGFPSAGNVTEEDLDLSSDGMNDGG